MGRGRRAIPCCPCLAPRACPAQQARHRGARRNSIATEHAHRGHGACSLTQQKSPHALACGLFIWLLNLGSNRSEEHTSELQSPCNLVCRLLLEKKKK